MGVITTTIDFANGDQVTSSKLDQIQGGSSFDPSAVFDDSLQVVGGKLKLGTVQTSNLAANSVTSDQIADDAVGADQLANNSVAAANIIDGSITTAEMADKAITIAKIADAAFAARAQVETPTSGVIPTPDLFKYHLGIVKAYGTVNWAPSDTALSGQYNVTSASRPNGQSRQIVLGVTMADTNYVVTPSWVEGATIATSLTVENKTTTGFTIFGSGEAVGRKASFTVFGKLA